MDGWDMNIWAVLVSTIVMYGLGALWYSPLLFATMWMKESGITMEAINSNPSKAPFIYSFVGCLVLAFALSYVTHATGSDTFGEGLGLGLVAGVGIIGAAAGPHYAFSMRSLKLYIIDEGQTVVGVIIMCVILALWQ